jgi:hypothetical protein
VGWLTKLQPEGSNEARESFEKIPRSSDEVEGEGIDARRVDDVVKEGQLSTKGARLLKKSVDLKDAGLIPFGEYAQLVRGGTEGLLPPRDAEILKQRLLQAVSPNAYPTSARASVPVPQLWKDIPDEDVLDSLYESFARHDSENSSVVPWKEVRPIAADMVTLLEGVDRDAAVRSVKRIPEVPTNVLHREVDMEDW